MDQKIATGVAAFPDSGQMTATKLPMTGGGQGSVIATAPRKVAIWFEGDQEFDLLPFIFFVTSANTVQQSFQFYFPDPPDELSYEKAVRLLDTGQKAYRDTYDAYVFITAKAMEGNLFFLESGPLVQITTWEWQQNFSPPSIFEYLFHSTLCGTLYALCPDVHGHPSFTMGCQFEYTRIKEQRRGDIALGYICADHRADPRRS